MNQAVRRALAALRAGKEKRITLTVSGPSDLSRSPFRLAYNRIILALQRKLVPSRFKNWLLRTTGMQVGHDACVPHDISFDWRFPELITLEHGCIVGGASTIRTHALKGKEFTLGRVVVGERSMMAGFTGMEPGAMLGKNCMLNLSSTLEGKTGEGELWDGRPAKLSKKLSPEEMEKFFRAAEGDPKQYYKEFKKTVREFMKDPSRTYLKVYYNGNRENAGDDWWRARSVFRIFYNGIIIEITRLLPHCFVKTLLLRMAGVKIGKRCYIGRGVVFDHIYCDTITLEDDVRIEHDCYFDGHEYTITQTVFGKVHIGRGVHIRHDTFLRTGTTIGEGTVIEPQSMTQRSIPAHEVWGGVPAAFLKKR